MPEWWSTSELRAILALGLAAGLACGAVWCYRRTGESEAPGARAARLDINRASAVELEALPGMTARQAAEIVAYRRRNGPFSRVEELVEVSGVRADHLRRWSRFLKVGTDAE